MPRKPLDSPEPKLGRRSGRPNWYITWTDPGTRRSRRFATGTEDRSAAEEQLRAFKDALVAPPNDPTIGELLDWRLNVRAAHVTTIGRMKEFAVPLKAYFGKRRPNELSSTVITGYYKVRKEQWPSIRRELEELRAALNAAEAEGIIERAPKIALPAKSQPRDRFLTKAQGKALIDAANSLHLRLFLSIALQSGARKGAILDLTWDRVDLDGGVIDFRNPDLIVTNKKRGVVPVSAPLRAAMAAAKELAQTDWVIEWNGQQIRDVRTGLEKAARKAGVPWVTPHTLKHTVISWLAGDGFTVDHISDLTDTEPETVRRIYRKVNPASLQPMADALGEAISGRARKRGRAKCAPGRAKD